MNLNFPIPDNSPALEHSRPSTVLAVCLLVLGQFFSQSISMVSLLTVPLPYHKAGLCVLQINCKNYDLSLEEIERRVSQLPMSYIPRPFPRAFFSPLHFEVGCQ